MWRKIYSAGNKYISTSASEYTEEQSYSKY